jgi:hypothetical protein
MIVGVLRYLLMLPIFALATVATYILAPFLVLFQKDGWLPNWCWWFQTWDNSLDGDNGWQTEHRPWLNTPYYQLNSVQVWVCRFMWLWRNPAYGFAYKLAPQADYTLTTYGHNNNILYVANTGWFFWNGKVGVSENYDFNWLIGWKLPYPDRPSPICCTMRFVKP